MKNDKKRKVLGEVFLYSKGWGRHPDPMPFLQYGTFSFFSPVNHLLYSLACPRREWIKKINFYSFIPTSCKINPCSFISLYLDQYQIKYFWKMENGFVFDRKTIAREVRFDTVWQTKYIQYIQKYSQTRLFSRLNIQFFLDTCTAAATLKMQVCLFSTKHGPANILIVFDSATAQV